LVKAFTAYYLKTQKSSLKLILRALDGRFAFVHLGGAVPTHATYSNEPVTAFRIPLLDLQS